MLGLGNSLTGGASQDPKAPDEISGLAIWYKNATAITSDGGTPDLVSKWEDSSGNSRHITQTTDGDKGTRVDGGIDMSGDNPEDHYEIAAASGRVNVGTDQGFTVAMVCAREGAGDDNNAIFGGNSNSRHLTVMTEEQIVFRTTDTGGVTSEFNFATDTWVIDTKMLITITKDTTGDFKFYKNGVQVGTTSTSNPTNNGLFNDVQFFGCRRDGSASSDFTWDGKIYEFALYSALLSDGDLSDLNSHLREKFELPRG